MKSKEEFVKKWRYTVTGMALFGTISEAKDGPMVRAARCHEIPSEVEKLLAAMHDFIAEGDKPPAAKPTNGQPARN